MGSGRRPEEMGGQEREWPLILNRRASLTEMRGNAWGYGEGKDWSVR